MKLFSLLIAMVMCVPLSAQTYVSGDAWLETERCEFELYASITSLEASAIPAAGSDIDKVDRAAANDFDFINRVLPPLRSNALFAVVVSNGK